MCSLLKKEIEKHLLLYGVVYVIEPTGALILADGRSCTVSDYKVIPETVHIKNGAFLNCTIYRISRYVHFTGQFHRQPRFLWV